MAVELKLEKWGPRIQWILTDREQSECFRCLEVVEEGYYCPRSRKFWCIKCEKQETNNNNGRSVCNCTWPMHESFSVICRIEDKGEKEEPTIEEE